MKIASWGLLAIVIITLGILSANAQTRELPPLNQNPEAANMNARDWQFMKKAAQDELAQIQLGQLAERKGENPAVRHLGQDLASIHSKRLDQLKSLAVQKAMTLPKQLSSNNQELVRRLEAMNGQQFDAAWLSATISNRERELDQFRSEIREGQDPSVTAYAKNALEIMPGELSRARELSHSLEARR